MCGDVPARGVHELGQEGEEEESSFGIEKVDEDSLAEDAGEAVGHRRRDNVSVCPANERPYTEENQIERTGELDDVKSSGGRNENCGKAEGGGCGMNECADRDSGGGDDASFAALADGPAKDVENGWAGDEQENERTGKKKWIG